MARPKTGNKPQDIRQATVDEVAVVGSTAVSVNKIAVRANLSVGTLYRYHATKDDLLLAVFIEVKTDIHKVMMAACNERTGAADRLRAMWFALVDFGLSAPRDFQFAEMLSSENRPTLQANPILQANQADVLAEIQAGIDAGTLLDAPVAAIETVLAAPAMTLIRRAAVSGQVPSRIEIEQVFQLVWRGLSR